MDSVIKLKENYIINKIAESVRKKINEEENLSDLAYKIYGSEDNSKGYYRMPRKSPFTKVDTLNNGNKFKISPDEIEKMKGLLSKKYNTTNVKENRFNNNLIRLTESDLHKIVKESVKRVLRESLEGTDEIEEAVANAASVIADAYHVQNGMQDIANDHDDSWYELQENIREAMLNAAMNVLNSAY